MNNLSKMMAEKKKVIICGEEFELEQMNIRELAKMAQLQQKDPTEAMLFLVKNTLRKSCPDMADEQMDKLKAPFVSELLVEILKINGLGEDKKKEHIIEPFLSKNESD